MAPTGENFKKSNIRIIEHQTQYLPSGWVSPPDVQFTGGPECKKMADFMNLPLDYILKPSEAEQKYGPYGKVGTIYTVIHMAVD